MKGPPKFNLKDLNKYSRTLHTNEKKYSWLFNGKYSKASIKDLSPEGSPREGKI